MRELFEGTRINLRLRRDSWDATHPSVEAAVACYADHLGPDYLLVTGRKAG